MRIFEFDTPGIEKILNVPQNPNQPKPAPVGRTGNVATQAGTNVTSNNQAITNSMTGAVQTLSPSVKQHLTPGGMVNLPTGPNSIPTQLKVKDKNVGVDKDRSITLFDPQHPNQPGQVYKYADLAKTLSDQEQKK